MSPFYERWDGTGYPLGIKGDSIPYLSQIISVVDAYDVMTHDRVYSTAISHEETMNEIRRCIGTQFAPDIVKLFDKMSTEISLNEITKVSMEKYEE